jgi:uncharacterized membrane protein
MADQETIGTAGATHSLPRVRAITPRDLVDVLAKGFEDFWAMPTHVIFLSLIYPIAGIIIAGVTLGYDLLPLFYPMAAGFALVGPFAAIGLYQLSWRREQGLDAGWEHAFDLLEADSFRAILALGLILLVIFGVWIAVAQAIYVAHFGYAPPDSIDAFVRQVLTTDAGRRMILVGNGVGFLFALVAFSISVVAFPLLIDRNISATGAAATSVKAVLRNPLTMALLGHDRRRRASDRIVAFLCRSGGGDPGARPFDLAPLPEGSRAGSATARETSDAAEGPALCSGFSGGAVPGLRQGNTSIAKRGPGPSAW